MTRNEMQDLLEEDDFRYIMNEDGGIEMLRIILSQGFSGYNNFTDQMLLDEIKGRGFLNA